MQTIELKHVYIEDIFDWFYVHILSSCGDGCATIICANYQEAADWFIEWFRKYKIWEFNGPYRDTLEERGFLHKKYYYPNSIIFHDSNENFIFTNTMPEYSFDGDYVFVVKAECSNYPINRKLQWTLLPAHHLIH